MCIKLSAIKVAVAGALFLPTIAVAQSPTANFTVQITITGSCQVNSTTNMDFNSHGVLNTNSDASSTVTVQCTNTTPFNLGLSAGSGATATIANRQMTGPGGATITYSLYRNAARDTVWGDTTGTNTLAGTGTGAAQQLTVYGRVPPQNTPAPGTYTDTVTATITY